MNVAVRRSRAILLGLLTSLAVVLALPAAASAAASAQFSTYEYGWCCSGDPVSTYGAFLGHEFRIENDGTVALALDTLRVTFDTAEHRWEDGADVDATDSELYAGFDDGVNWNYTVNETPLSAAVPAACAEVSTAGTLVTYECDLQATPVDIGHIGWVGLKALLPADTFLYGAASVDFELRFVGDVLPPFTYTENFDYVAGDSNLKVDGGYVGDPALLDHNFTREYRDADNESSGVTYGAGDVVPYRFRFQNPEHATDPTSVAHGISIEFNIPTDSANDWETQLQDGDVTATGGLTNPDCVLDVDNGTDQTWICSFDGHVPVDGTATVTIPILFVDAVDLGGGSGGIQFYVNTANSTMGSLQPVEENTYASTGPCQLPRFFGEGYPNSGPDEFERYAMYGTATIAQIESGDPIRFELPCEEPVASPLTNYSSTTGMWTPSNGYSNSGLHAGIFRGPANASYSWLSNEAVTPGPGNAYAFTWEGVGLTGVAPGDVVDTARIAAAPLAGGDYYRIMFHVTAQEQADLGVTLGGPASLEVASGGSQATYTATVSNAGPHTATSSTVKVQLPASATFVSGSGGSGGDACSAAAQLVTCTIANLASGSSRAFTIVASYKAGVNGLTLPATVNATATVDGVRAWAVDATSANDSASQSIALSAPQSTTTTTTTCASGQIGTPPNCITPLTLVGGSGTRTFLGSWAPDRFTGGSGNETFYAGAGGDTASGGGGRDRLFGGTGADRLSGGTGDDRIFGGNGDDVLRGGDGNDHVHGGNGIDSVQGDDGDDRVSCGEGGVERAYGGAGTDVVSCLDGAAGDTVSGGTGAGDLCIGEVRDTYIGCERVIRVFIPLL